MELTGKVMKVIGGLKCCLPMTTRDGIGDCKNCPYDRKITLEGGITECCHELIGDVLALLEAQEPRHGEWEWTHGGECSECGFHNSNFNYKFCPMCGAVMDR